jgi:2-dehydro-3-deoxygalactonokinase
LHPGAAHGDKRAMSKPLFLAVDWGTSNLRAWVIADSGEVLAEERFPWGVGKLPPGEPERRLRESVRPVLAAEDLPVLMCGMIGSTLGIVEVPYLDCPAGLDDLSRALALAPGVEPEGRIAPGLRCRRPNGDPDVMRGEETKILGWASLDPARRKGRRLLVLPGTHAKWALLEGGRIVRFITAMSGELFDLLTRHSVLRTEDGPDDPDAFLAGARIGAQDGPLAAKLFTARSKVVGGGMPKSAVRDYVSGLLVGDETAHLPSMIGAGDDDNRIDLLGDPALCRLYETALTDRGVEVETHDGDQAVLAGLTALYRHGVAR